MNLMVINLSLITVNLVDSYMMGVKHDNLDNVLRGES